MAMDKNAVAFRGFGAARRGKREQTRCKISALKRRNVQHKHKNTIIKCSSIAFTREQILCAKSITRASGSRAAVRPEGKRGQPRTKALRRPVI
eukprot:1886606-Pleurochrysis_carterae.AAC.13